MEHRSSSQCEPDHGFGLQTTLKYRDPEEAVEEVRRNRQRLKGMLVDIKRSQKREFSREIRAYYDGERRYDQMPRVRVLKTNTELEAKKALVKPLQAYSNSPSVSQKHLASSKTPEDKEIMEFGNLGDINQRLFQTTNTRVTKVKSAVGRKRFINLSSVGKSRKKGSEHIVGRRYKQGPLQGYCRALDATLNFQLPAPS